MRHKSSKKDGFQIFAVSGVNTISFAIQATEVARKGLLGFAVERRDLTEDEQYFMPSFKVFQSIIPHPNKNTHVTTFDHPVQSFVWDDFTAKDSHEYEYLFYPVRGKPKSLDHSADAIKISVKTEPLFSKQEHDVFFNRGVASSQAYSRKFDNMSPSQLEKNVSAEKAQEALDWLSRDLDDALLRFIRQAKSGDTLLCCFYEFRYEPVAIALKKAIDDGVHVKLIIDAKVNERTDKKGKFHPSFPREENLALLRKTKIPKAHVILREAKPNDIQHNKFMVLLKGAKGKPTEVWTGSTNISDGGIHGQTNVGHWVRSGKTAALFQSYWELLSNDPGGQADDDKADVRSKNSQFRSDVEALLNVPLKIDEIHTGITPVFSPRSGLKVLDLYFDIVDSAEASAFITLAFGLNKAFKEKLKDNTGDSAITFLLLEKKDEPNAKNRDSFVAIDAANNVYEAWGSFLRDPLYQWTKETNTKIWKLNKHVSYIHSKFLLRDPLGDDPIVVTGSANFSGPSTTANDENMIIIRGDKRVADIYFTEFNRLFFHYYFRSVTEVITATGHNYAEGWFLKEKSEEWLIDYKPGKLKQKRVDMYSKMKGFE
jgi:phosphatidylserine/phosphatidylglycerophosphate/cardiolipin synthase-like enzyme